MEKLVLLGQFWSHLHGHLRYSSLHDYLARSLTFMSRSLSLKSEFICTLEWEIEA